MNRFIGKRLEVLFEEHSNEGFEYYEGYTTNYIRARVNSHNTLIGEVKSINITDSYKDILIGEI